MRYLNSITNDYLNSLKKSELVSLLVGYRDAIAVGETLPEKICYSSSDAVANYFRTYDYSNYRENLFIMLLKSDLSLYRVKLISLGGESNVPSISLSIIFKEILSEKSPVNRFIVVHNHPSGSPEPSDKDIDFTTGLFKASKLLDLELVDHVIIAGEGDALTHISLRSMGKF